MQLQSQFMELIKSAREANLTISDFRRICERQLVIQVLTEECCNVTNSARTLGVHRNTLIRQIDTLDINIYGMRGALKKQPQSVGIVDKAKALNE